MPELSYNGGTLGFGNPCRHDELVMNWNGGADDELAMRQKSVEIGSDAIGFS